MTTGSRLRRRSSTAPLKPVVGDALRADVDESPSTIIDGPIEAWWSVPRERGNGGLRRRSSTAPLKRGSGNSAGGGASTSPSTIIDGPIEAVMHDATHACRIRVSVDDHR